MTDERTSDEIYVATLSQQLVAITRRAFVPQLKNPLLGLLSDEPKPAKQAMKDAIETARKLHPEVFGLSAEQPDHSENG